MWLAVGEQMLDAFEPDWVRIAGGLAGGLGDSGEEMCGALSGGALVIGGLYGRQSSSEDDSVVLDLTCRYRQRFLAEFGSTRCNSLRGIVEAPGGPGSCADVVERAAEMLLELLEAGG